MHRNGEHISHPLSSFSFHADASAASLILLSSLPSLPSLLTNSNKLVCYYLSPLLLNPPSSCFSTYLLQTQLILYLLCLCMFLSVPALLSISGSLLHRYKSMAQCPLPDNRVSDMIGARPGLRVVVIADSIVGMPDDAILEEGTVALTSSMVLQGTSGCTPYLVISPLGDTLSSLPPPPNLKKEGSTIFFNCKDQNPRS